MLVKYSLIFPGMLYMLLYLFNFIINLVGIQDLSITNYYDSESFLSIIPFILMWRFIERFIEEKFDDKRLLRKSSVSLTTVWAGKIAAIFLLSYPSVILGMITVSLIQMILGKSDLVIVLSADSWEWVMIIFVNPMIPMTYASFAGWAILRFANWQRMVDLLLFLVLAAYIAIVFVSTIFLTDDITVPLTNWQVVISIITGHVALFVLAFYLVSRLDREKVITN